MGQQPKVIDRGGHSNRRDRDPHPPLRDLLSGKAPGFDRGDLSRGAQKGAEPGTEGRKYFLLQKVSKVSKRLELRAVAQAVNTVFE